MALTPAGRQVASELCARIDMTAAPAPNHFNHDRHLNRRDIFKQNRSAALAEWRQLAA